MKHILVVDDDPAMLTLLTRMLSAMQYRVIAASNGPAAIAAFAANRVDLLVTDYRMPDMDGRELIAALQAERPDLKTLVVTGCPPVGPDDQAWWVAQPSLTKPFPVQSLQSAVIALIGPS